MTTMTSQHINLRDMTPNQYIDGTYSIVNPQLGVTRAGKPYLKCLVRDATGEAAARQWSFEENMLGEVGATGFVWISGHTQLYNDQVQIILEQIRAVEVSTEDIITLLPSTNKNIDEMYTELKCMLNSIQHPAMRALAQVYIDDDDLMAKFKQAPAAMSLHHAWIGGLLEHTLQLLKLAEAMLPLYPRLNRDMVLMGLFLHDLCKTGELTWEKGFDYTPDGNLVGHVVRGAILLQFKAAIAGKQSGHKLSPEALRALQHIIISHHARPEFGAAKLPSTPEAIFVALLDNLDAKTSMGLEAARPEYPSAFAGEFTDKVWALETRLYCPDPLTLE